MKFPVEEPPTVQPLGNATKLVILDPPTVQPEYLFGKTIVPLVRSMLTAEATILTVSVEDLSAASVSPGSDTVAILLTVPEAVLLTLTVSVMVPAEAPGPMGPAFVQLTVWAALWHDQPAPVAKT